VNAVPSLAVDDRVVLAGVALALVDRLFSLAFSSSSALSRSVSDTVMRPNLAFEL
jgi:hypothetical protein